MEFIPAGLGLWVSRSNAYTILKDSETSYRLCDGYGRTVATAESFEEAKTIAEEHSDLGDRMDDFQWQKVDPEAAAQAEAEDGDWRKEDDGTRDSIAEDGDF